MYMCVCIHMCVSTYIYVCTYVYIYICVRMYTYIHIHTYIAQVKYFSFVPPSLLKKCHGNFGKIVDWEADLESSS